MEFEEMQVIWNSQDDEKLFAINETALYEYVKGKSRSINHWLQMVEWMMIALNPLVGIALIFDALQDSGPDYQFVIAVIYIAYSLYGLYRRLTRRREEVRFEASMLGELDKAIWRADYLIRQGRSLMLWYLLPLVLVASLFLLFDGKLYWALALMFILTPAAYLGMRWETNKWHRPKKQALESLRETLIASEETAA